VPFFYSAPDSREIMADSPGPSPLFQYKKNHEWQAAVGFLISPLGLVGDLVLSPALMLPRLPHPDMRRSK